ncbi:hypothetical protein CPB84DRAFT_1749725 [Gymnopilus junonius]|uniref:Uncharacterized protein n=1 Tax=Gymnopilus junonius TaxID=109634 RepID=A0A9P5NJL4_GYMJU|nr:hypothetical protein CPB84DRAFT_1749725 [Gymnopilus junonius]
MLSSSCCKWQQPCRYTHSLAKKHESEWNAPICWWAVDPVHDANAEQLIAYSLLYIWKLNNDAYFGKCYSSAPLQHVVLMPEIYTSTFGIQELPSAAVRTLYHEAEHSLRNDKTTLDEGGDNGDEENLDSQDNSKSEDAGSEHLDATANYHQIAIDGQIQNQIEYDIKHLLPTLHGIANLLSDSPSLTPTLALEEFFEVVSKLQSRLTSFNSTVEMPTQNQAVPIPFTGLHVPVDKNSESKCNPRKRPNLL